MNKARQGTTRQRRRSILRGKPKRGIGYTRQCSSKRARKKHGTPCLGEVEDQSTLSKFWQNVVGYEPPKPVEPMLEAEGDTVTFIDEAQTVAEEEPSTLAKVQQEHTDKNMHEEAKILLSGGAKEAIKVIKSGLWDGFGKYLREVEEAGKNRKTVLAAIEKIPAL